MDYPIADPKDEDGQSEDDIDWIVSQHVEHLIGLAFTSVDWIILSFDQLRPDGLMMNCGPTTVQHLRK